MPSEDLEEFFKGAKAARQSDEGIGSFSNKCFASVHGAGDVKLGEATVGYFEFNQDLRDDSNNLAVSGESGFGDSQHESDLSSAVDETDIVSRDGATQLFGGGFVCGVGSISRGAEDSYVANHVDEDIKYVTTGHRPVEKCERTRRR